MAPKQPDLRVIPIDDIRENPVALRSVNRTSESYLGLVDSIRQEGVLNAITVREATDTETGQSFLMLIDGLHRFMAAQDAGLDAIPANVLDKTDAEVLATQVMANVHKVETRPVEYSRQLIRILSYDPLLTTAALAARLSKSPAWISERLGLLKLDDSIAEMVNEGKVNLSNAYALAKLPKEEQADFVDRAMTMSPQEFVPLANGRAKEIRDARRQGRDAADAEFVPIPRLQKLSVLREELETLERVTDLVVSHGIKDPIEAAHMAIKFVLHMDPRSIEEAKAKEEARKKDREEAKQKRQGERATKRATEAASKAEEAKEDANRIAKGEDPEVIKAERKKAKEAADAKVPAEVTA